MARSTGAYDVAGQLLWEREARKAGMTLKAELVGQPPRVQYRFPIDVPVYDDTRAVTVALSSMASHDEPIVYIDGPICLRHRWNNGSLCMWDNPDPPDMRWVPEDGFLALVGHIRVHSWCEAACRAGKSWPKPESSGQHPRRHDCPSCRGRSCR